VRLGASFACKVDALASIDAFSEPLGQRRDGLLAGEEVLVRRQLDAQGYELSLDQDLAEAARSVAEARDSQTELSEGSEEATDDERVSQVRVVHGVVEQEHPVGTMELRAELPEELVAEHRGSGQSPAGLSRAFGRRLPALRVPPWV
jgi:hypothetical protein